MKSASKLFIVGALVLGAVFGATSLASADGTCGGDGQKPCPLQGWMEENVQIPMEKGDLKKVAAALEKAAKFAPDKAWNEGAKGWTALAKQGVEAAKSGDLKATKKSCKGCHKAFRKQYKAKFRTRAVPK